MKPGTIYVFPLKAGLSGACRVLRGPLKSEMSFYEGHVLVHATKWIGESPPDLNQASLRKIARGNRGPSLHWVNGKPPKKFVEVGLVAVQKTEQSKTSNSSAPWGIFQTAVLTAWEKTNDPAGLEKKREAAKAKTKQTEESLLAELESKERIDLSGFVPLATPKSKPDPEQVLKGFIAAMNQ